MEKVIGQIITNLVTCNIKHNDNNGGHKQ